MCSSPPLPVFLPSESKSRKSTALPHTHRWSVAGATYETAPELREGNGNFLWWGRRAPIPAFLSLSQEIVISLLKQHPPASQQQWIHMTGFATLSNPYNNFDWLLCRWPCTDIKGGGGSTNMKSLWYFTELKGGSLWILPPATLIS